MTAPGDASGAGGASGDAAGISGWEWLVAALGVALVAGAVAVLVLQAVRDHGAPPDLTVTADTVVRVRAGYLVEFRAENHGDEAAADVTVRGELAAAPAAGGAPETVESSETQLDYVPARSRRWGALVFARDPRTAPLRLRVTGYQEP